GSRTEECLSPSAPRTTRPRLLLLTRARPFLRCSVASTLELLQTQRLILYTTLSSEAHPSGGSFFRGTRFYLKLLPVRDQRVLEKKLTPTETYSWAYSKMDLCRGS